MCGIFGCLSINEVNISKLIMCALNLLKNRGYDSCGIYLCDNNMNSYTSKYGIDGELIKNANQKDIFILLEDDINKLTNINYNVGIGHTRWATHGGKTDYNSHPHTSNNNMITLVHNGIISNYNELKNTYLSDYIFYSNTDTEVIANMIQYLSAEEPTKCFTDILDKLTTLLEGTWACIIHNINENDKLYFMKNENPLLIGKSQDTYMLTSEPSGFMNTLDTYILLRDKTYGYITNNNIKIYGEYKELNLIKSNIDDIKLDNYDTWMLKEIHDQTKLLVLQDPVNNTPRYDGNNVLLNIDGIKSCKYLYIIACGSSYYAGLIASNYFRYTKAFEFVNVFDGGEFTKAHLEAINNPEDNLLIVLISQSGETRDLNLATTICREYSSNRKNKLEPNKLLNKSDSWFTQSNTNSNNNGEIKIIGIINVIGSLISRRTLHNIYTNCGRENAVASTKSCTSQILACLLLAIYKAELNNVLETRLKNKFLNDLNNLEHDIQKIIDLNNKLKNVAQNILAKNKSSMFLLGKDELHGSALEGALKIKEISYIHAEGFNITALKHGPYALIENDTPIIILYKERDHFVKSIVEEITTRGAYVIEISFNVLNNDQSIKIPDNKTFTGLLSVISLQLLAYHLSVLQGINPDRPRNLAKVVTVD